MKEIFGHKVKANIPFLITLIYTFQCVRCGRRVHQRWTGNQLGLPVHPGIGWKEKEVGVWLCPKHSGVKS